MMADALRARALSSSASTSAAAIGRVLGAGSNADSLLVGADESRRCAVS